MHCCPGECELKQGGRSVRRIYSIQRELLTTSKEAALNAVQTFNNPMATFKSETFITQMVIAWRCMLHAYFRKLAIDYRKEEPAGGRRRFKRTSTGAYWRLSLRECLQHDSCPLDKPTKANLFFLLGLRDEIEHHVCIGLDERLSARYLACCLNFQAAITDLFGKKHSLEKLAAVTLQFSSVLLEPSSDLTPAPLPAAVTKYIEEFDEALPDEDFNSPRFAFRLIFTQKLVNHKGQADKVIEFVAPDSVIGEAINKQYYVLKPVEKPKWRASEVVAMMKDEGHARFSMYQHTRLWKAKDAKSPKFNYGVELGGQWFWYENWVQAAREECEAHPELYGPPTEMGLTA